MTDFSSQSFTAAVADHLLAHRDNIGDQWLRAVAADFALQKAGDLSHTQLLDHLPKLFADLCDFLHTRDARLLSGEISFDAQKHGRHRWGQGYKLDEVLRELDVLRRIILAQIRYVAPSEEDSVRDKEEAARTLIEEFFSVTTRESIEQFVGEQRELDIEYTKRLETGNHELQLAQGRLTELANSRARLPAQIAQQIAIAVQALSELGGGVSAPSSDGQNRQGAVLSLEVLIGKLQRFSVLLAGKSSRPDAKVKLRELFVSLAGSFKSAAPAGVEIESRFDFSLHDLLVDSDLFDELARTLWWAATGTGYGGRARIAASQVDARRWSLEIAVLGTGCAMTSADKAGVTAQTTPGFAFEIVKELAVAAGGSARVVEVGASEACWTVLLPISSGGDSNSVGEA
jgi:hypothetical protein